MRSGTIWRTSAENNLQAELLLGLVQGEFLFLPANARYLLITAIVYLLIINMVTLNNFPSLEGATSCLFQNREHLGDQGNMAIWQYSPWQPWIVWCYHLQ